jgi:RimJ/RimL family protein N-acetyltransferase
MNLIAIAGDGSTALDRAMLPSAAHEALPATAANYRRRGFAPPWIGYLAEEDGAIVGTCAFVAAPKAGEVEIAYYTFAEYEGQGVATRMARLLIDVAAAADPAVIVKAHTRPEENASTAILRKLGFTNAGVVQHPEDGEIWLWRRAATP